MDGRRVGWPGGGRKINARLKRALALCSLFRERGRALSLDSFFQSAMTLHDDKRDSGVRTNKYQ